MANKHYLPNPNKVKYRPTNRELPGQADPEEYGGIKQSLPRAPDPFGQYAANLPNAPVFGTDYSNKLPGAPDINTGTSAPQLPGAPNPYGGFRTALPGFPELVPYQRPPVEPIETEPPDEPERPEYDIPDGPRLHNAGWLT